MPPLGAYLRCKITKLIEITRHDAAYFTRASAKGEILRLLPMAKCCFSCLSGNNFVRKICENKE